MGAPPSGLPILPQPLLGCPAMRTRTVVVGGLALVFGFSRSALAQEHPAGAEAEHAHEHEHEAEAAPPAGEAAEAEAFARARPGFERFCFDCHATAGAPH